VTLRTRRTVAVLCIAVVLVAGMLPAVSTALGPVVLVALYLVVPAVAVTAIRRTASDSREQPASLLALFDSRGPPCAVALA
jgi:putative copper export protein